MDKTLVTELLHGQKFRLTNERKELLHLFMEAGKMLTPSQLHDTTKNSDVHVGLTTVYRLLEVLTKVGLATPILVDGTIYYTFCTSRHHHHFVCLRCHDVQNIYDCPHFEHLPAGCDVKYHKVDLFGTCQACLHLQS